MDEGAATQEPTNPLLTEATEPQRSLLELVLRSYKESNEWPIFQYPDLTLAQQPEPLDALSVLLSCPRVHYPSGMSAYGWFWVTDNRLGTPHPGDRIGLSVVGMSRIRDFALGRWAEGEINRFFDALHYVVTRELEVKPSPAAVQEIVVGSEEIRVNPLTPIALTGGLSAEELERLRTVLEHEPPTQNHTRPDPSGAGWTVRPGVSTRPYDGIWNVEHYAEKVIAEIAPPQPETEPEPTLVSSFAIPEALDYLNLVWNKCEGDDLFLFRKGTAPAILSHDCQTKQDFDSWVTALYGILCTVRIPGTDRDRRPSDIRRFLAERHPPDGTPRTDSSVAVLEAIFELRDGIQHPGAGAKQLQAMRLLGVKLRITDWEPTCLGVQARVVAALNALREDIELLDDLGG